MSFQIDKKAIEKVARAELTEQVKEWNRDLEKLARQMKGKPRNQVKPKLESLMKKLDLKLGQGQIEQFAEAIEQGVIPQFKL